MIKGKGRILLMDDEDFILDVTSEVLESLGYSVDKAHDGHETIKMYKESLQSNRRYDVVIMDLTIPGKMGGKEAVKLLLELDPEAKVIVSSGYSSDATMSEYSKYGFSGVIPKPYRLEDISRIIDNVIHNKNGRKIN